MPLDAALHARPGPARRLPEAPLLEVEVGGDLTGAVRWHLSPTATGTRLDFAQDVTVQGRLLGWASYVGRPLLAWNHDRMMAGCLIGLRRQLALPVGA
ncbi:hypothetical protein [Nocardioides ungokensis]|uniref:hypothetical protein n=1 Tax=Nocardioides ungokensis TaxID=1643322 RepID=UPI001FE72D04|nr:hypothetical protein [Nocardioides ungokensis]